MLGSHFADGDLSKSRFPLCLCRSCIGLFVMIAVVVIFSSCRQEQKAKKPFGYIEGDFVYMSPLFNGKLEKLHVKKGETVKKGDLLFSLDGAQKQARLQTLKAFHDAVQSVLADMKKGERPSTINYLENQVESAKILVDGAKTGHERTSEMYKKNAISFKYFNIVKHIWLLSQSIQKGCEIKVKNASLGSREDRIAAVKSVLAATGRMISEAEWDVVQMKVKAPTNAFVFDTYYHEGEIAATGKPVLSLLPPENIKARFYVGEDRVSRLAIGRQVKIEIDGVARPVPGVIDYISPKESYTPPVIFSKDVRSKLVYLVEASFQPEDARKLHPGQPITVDLGLE